MGCGSSAQSTTSAPQAGASESAKATVPQIDGAHKTLSRDVVDKENLLQLVEPHAVIVFCAQDLPKSDMLRHGQFYAKVWVDTAERLAAGPGYGSAHRSAAVEGANPTWNMGFLLDVHGMRDPQVRIKIFDQELFSESECVGSAEISLKALSEKELELSLGEGKGFVKALAGKDSEGSFLQTHGVSESSMFPKLHALGEIKTCMASDVKGDFPLRTGKAPLPKATRGVYWLSGQAEGSALASFAGPSNDGGGCSVGHMVNNMMKLRCGGDRSWAEASKGPADNVEIIDLIYNFVFDSSENPTKAQIYPEWKFVGALTTEWVMDFEMYLAEEDAEYPGSVVWQRSSFFFGGNEAVGSRYKLIQIIDENGERLEPAFSKWVEYQNSVNADNPAKEPGKIWYREIA